MDSIIYKNNFVVISKCADGLYIETFMKGFSIHEFNAIISTISEIRITSFISIKNALLNAPQPPVKFGEIKNRISIEISNNNMNAYVILCVEESEYLENNRNLLIREILLNLRDKGIVFGVKIETLRNNLSNNTRILIAEGIPPINGEDAKIKMFVLKDPRPEIKEDGKADYYELNLINKVMAGDWLGESIDPTDGTPGKTIKGEKICPLSGKRYPLFYDLNTVKEVYKDGITTLYSIINGAVHYNGDKISVSNYLEISEDVGFKTGNIDFDGFLTIKGAIADNFIVAAKNDIEILGEFGIGSVKEVVSRNGSVYIKGGIIGKNKAVIRSSKDLYTKFISDATIICEGIVHIGFYCLNSNITAKQVIIDSNKGQIIGGVIQAEQKVAASYLGNTGEKRTQIIVSGFNRKEVKDNLDQLQKQMEVAKNKLTKAKQVFSIYSYTIDSGSKQYKEFEAAKENYFMLKDEVKKLEIELKSIIKCFKVKGEGEIDVSKRAYPNTILEINRIIKEIRKETLSTCYYLNEGEIREI